MCYLTKFLVGVNPLRLLWENPTMVTRIVRILLGIPDIKLHSRIQWQGTISVKDPLRDTFTVKLKLLMSLLGPFWNHV